jgi:hypothetical protein
MAQLQGRNFEAKVEDEEGGVLAVRAIDETRILTEIPALQEPKQFVLPGFLLRWVLELGKGIRAS